MRTGFDVGDGRERRSGPGPFAWPLLLVVSVAASTASAQIPSWENRGQPEFGAASLDVAAGGHVVVEAGAVEDELLNWQWHVRAVDRGTGATKWEDRFGPMTFGSARDAAVEGGRAFVAGWIRTDLGFEFVARAYDLESGAVLWSQQVHQGPQCPAESPNFSRCVAKAVDVHDGRVFVVGHLSRTAARSDFAVLAFSAATGAPLWESVTDPTGTGANDYAWAVKAQGDSVFVLGEVGNYSSLLLRSYNARTGAIRWQQEVKGASNLNSRYTLAADSDHVFIGGMDANLDFMVRAYDARSGALRWKDRVDDGDRGGYAYALTIGRERGRGRGDGERRLFATGDVGCDPVTFLDCKLGVRAYDLRRGLVWQRADDARGGDWFPGTIAVAAGRVFVEAGELLGDGEYHPTVRAYAAGDGDMLWDQPFDPGDPAGHAIVSTDHGQLFVGGTNFRGPDGSSDLVLRMYRARDHQGLNDDDECGDDQPDDE